MRARQVSVSGGSVAALVTAERLIAAGANVKVFVPERGAGGSFAGYGPDHWPIGMRLIELEYDLKVRYRAAPKSFTQYVPGPKGHTRWQPLVAQYIIDLLGYEGLHSLPSPLHYEDGQLRPDWLLTGRLQYAPDDPDATALRLATKIMGHGALGRVPNKYRQKLWLPPPKHVKPRSYDPGRTFWRDTTGGMAQIVSNLLDRLRGCIEVGENLDADLVSPNQFPGGLDRIRSRILYVECDPDFPEWVNTVVWVLDDAWPFWRLSPATIGGNVWCVEMCHSDTPVPVDDLGGFMHGRVIDELVGDGPPEPTVTNRKRYEVLNRLWPLHHKGRLIGPYTALGADSLNEQIFQGHKAARDWLQPKGRR